MAGDQLPDMSRTKKAIEEYDAFDATFVPFMSTERSGPEVQDWFAKLDALGKAVGITFGLDTADRNSMSACSNVRPGFKTPPPGDELSFVRRTVAKWEADNA